MLDLPAMLNFSVEKHCQFLYEPTMVVGGVGKMTRTKVVREESNFPGRLNNQIMLGSVVFIQAGHETRNLFLTLIRTFDWNWGKLKVKIE